MKTLFLIEILFGIFLFYNFSFSQEINSEKIIFTGNLSNDSKIVFNENYDLFKKNNLIPSNGEKSPALSGILSAVIPGAGQFYNEDYWKTGIFVAVEATVISLALIYDKKGDDKTTEFQNYADSKNGWSVVKYAQWLIDFHEADPNIITSSDESLPPWKRVNFNLLHQYEVGSHQLPTYGEQQYYELIGKYHQFSPGWADFNPDNSNENIIPEQMLFYSQMRGDANDFYGNASTAVIGIYVNHILSVVEAIWSTSRYNKDIAVNFRLENEYIANRIELIPTIKLKYKF